LCVCGTGAGGGGGGGGGWWGVGGGPGVFFVPYAGCGAVRVCVEYDACRKKKRVSWLGRFLQTDAGRTARMGRLVRQRTGGG
jgi:hypothetical protein